MNLRNADLGSNVTRILVRGNIRQLRTSPRPLPKDEVKKIVAENQPDRNPTAACHLSFPFVRIMKYLNIFFVLACACVQASGEPRQPVILDDFQLVGDLSSGGAAFTLSATARVENSRGGTLAILSGPVALTEIKANPKYHVAARDGQFILKFDRAGKFPVELKFQAARRAVDGWNEIHFNVASSTIQPIRLRGLPADTQFDFADAARPEYRQSEFVSFLGGDGAVKLRWKEARPEGEGRLFYAAEMLSQVNVSPGLLRQAALLDFKVMQGELNAVTILLRGTGEVTRVQGDQVLAWNIEPVANSSDRRLVVRLNQPQRDRFGLQIQTQAPLGAFPQTADVLRLRPEAATRFAGYYRIMNEGAVRLEVLPTGGLSQISPEQFPETELTRSLLRPDATQRFAYRFSGPDFSLRIQADQILPELNVSELLSYRLGENEQSIDGEFEFDIRAAPVRELTLRVPRGYAVAQLNAAGLSDYFLVEPENQADAELRLLFEQPLLGRQVATLRLERNKLLGEASWSLPRVTVAKAKSVRGYMATAAEAGFRLTPERTAGLTEIATAFFPRKVAGMQSAFRLSDPAWQASLRVERLAQTVQADVLHLFSIGEGIAYGSSIINYLISGARSRRLPSSCPMSTSTLSLPAKTSAIGGRWREATRCNCTRQPPGPTRCWPRMSGPLNHKAKRSPLPEPALWQSNRNRVTRWSSALINSRSSPWMSQPGWRRSNREKCPPNTGCCSTRPSWRPTAIRRGHLTLSWR